MAETALLHRLLGTGVQSLGRETSHPQFSQTSACPLSLQTRRVSGLLRWGSQARGLRCKTGARTIQASVLGTGDRTPQTGRVWRISGKDTAEEDGRRVMGSPGGKEERFSGGKDVWVRPGSQSQTGNGRPSGTLQGSAALAPGLSPIVAQLILALNTVPADDEAVAAKMEAWVEDISMPDVVNLLKELGRQGDLVRGVAVLNWMRATQDKYVFQPNVRVYTTLIAACGRQRSFQVARRLFREMAAEGLKPDVFAYNALLGGYARSGLIRDARGTFSAMKRDGLVPDAVSFREVLLACSRSASLKDTLPILEEMRESGVRLEANTYRLAIEQFSSRHDHGAVVALYETMEGDGVKPDRLTTNTVIAAYGRKGLCEHAERVFQDLQKQDLKPDSFTYNSLLLAYSKNGRQEEAEGVLQDMRQAGCHPNPSTFAYLMEGYGVQGRFEEAESVFQDMKQVGVIPDVVTYNTLILAYCRAGHCRWAESVVEEMVKSNLEPSVVTYTMLIDAYAKAGKVHDVDRLLGDMRQRGLQANAVTYNCLLAAYCRGGQFDMAWAAMHEMIRSSLSPDDITYIAVVDSYRRGPEGHKVEKLFEELLRYGQRPETKVYVGLVEAFVREREYEKAAGVLSTMELRGDARNQGTLGVMMDAYARIGMVEEARAIYDSLPARGFVLGTTSCNIIVAALGLEGLHDEAEALVQEMTASGQRISSPNFGTWLSLLEGYAAHGRPEFERAEAKLRQEGFQPGGKAYTFTIMGLAQAGQFDRVERVLQEMEEVGARPQVSTYSCILAGLAGRLKLPETAIALRCLEQCRCPAHVVVKNLVSDMSQEGSWDLSLRQALNKMPKSGHWRDTRLHQLFNALLDVLHAEGLHKHAADVVAVSRERGMYLHSCPPPPTSPDEDWVVDLRWTSAGAAAALLMQWLQREVQAAVASAEAGATVLPNKAQVVVARTVAQGARRVEGSTPLWLKAAHSVRNTLRELSIPFDETPGDEAMVEVSGTALRDWALATYGGLGEGLQLERVADVAEASEDGSAASLAGDGGGGVGADSRREVDTGELVGA